MTASANSDTLFDSIAQLLPEDQREYFYRRMAHLRQLNPDDDLLQVAEAMGFLALLIRDTPPLIASERHCLETCLRQALASMEGLHHNTLQSNSQIEDRLLNLPAEIQVGISPDAIAAKIAESIHQTFIETELPAITQQLQFYAGAITQATHQLAAIATILDDPQSGASARVQRASTSMLASVANVATHIRTVTKDLTAQIRHSIALLCTAALTLGFLLGWFLHQ